MSDINPVYLQAIAAVGRIQPVDAIPKYPAPKQVKVVDPDDMGRAAELLEEIFREHRLQGERIKKLYNLYLDNIMI